MYEAFLEWTVFSSAISFLGHCLRAAGENESDELWNIIPCEKRFLSLKKRDPLHQRAGGVEDVKDLSAADDADDCSKYQ